MEENNNNKWWTDVIGAIAGTSITKGETTIVTEEKTGANYIPALIIGAVLITGGIIILKSK